MNNSMNEVKNNEEVMNNVSILEYSFNERTSIEGFSKENQEKDSSRKNSKNDAILSQKEVNSCPTKGHVRQSLNEANSRAKDEKSMPTKNVDIAAKSSSFEYNKNISCLNEGRKFSLPCALDKDKEEKIRNSSFFSEKKNDVMKEDDNLNNSDIKNVKLSNNIKVMDSKRKSKFFENNYKGSEENREINENIDLNQIKEDSFEKSSESKSK